MSTHTKGVVNPDSFLACDFKKTFSWNISVSRATSSSINTMLSTLGVIEFLRGCLFQFEPNISLFSIGRSIIHVLLPSTIKWVLQQPWLLPLLLLVMSDMFYPCPLPWPFFIMEFLENIGQAVATNMIDILHLI
jgi:hypothetical protein